MFEFRDLNVVLLIYFISCIFVISAFIYHKVSQGVINLSIFLVFTFYNLLVSLRPIDSGNDTPRYALAFDNINSFSSSYDVGVKYFGNTEFGFWPFASLIKGVVPFSGAFIYITSVLAFFLLLFFIFIMVKNEYAYKDSLKLVPLFLISTLSSYYIIYMGNHIRASIAIPLSYLFIYFTYVNGEKVKGFSCGIASFSFHFSSMMAFLTKPALMVTKRKVWLIISLASIASVSIIPMIVGFSTDYLPFLKDKYELYFEFNKVAEFDSIYGLTNFKILAFFFAVSLINYQSTFSQNIFIFWFNVIIIFSAIPQVAERFFPFALMIMYLSLYDSLYKFNEKFKAVLIMLVSIVVFIATIFSDSARYTINI